MLSKLRLFLAYAFAAVLLATTFAQAQRPALTKSVDEPGRTPYNSHYYATCLERNCTFTFAPVPSGFRLVVTYLSAFYLPANDHLATYAFLGDINFNPTYVPPSTTAGSAWATFSSPIAFYVEPGITPIFTITGTEAGTNASATITGYLVAIP